MIAATIIISTISLDTAIQQVYAQPSVIIGSLTCTGPQGSQLIVEYSFGDFHYYH
jgi:hypothetical protein